MRRLISITKQLGVVLFENMKIPGGRKTKNRLLYGCGCAGETGTGVSDRCEDSGIPTAYKIKIDLCGRTGRLYSGRWKDSREI